MTGLLAAGRRQRTAQTRGRNGAESRGEITVFLSMCILCVAALLCVMAESVRLAGSRYYFQVTVGGALDSLFSRYHRDLWEQYRVLGLPWGSRQSAEDRLQFYMGKYLETENWYPMRLESVEITESTALTDQGGDFLAQEILDYMKFGVWGYLDITPESGGQLMRDIREAVRAGGLTDAYREQAGEVQRLERAVEKIAACVKRQEEAAAEIAAGLAGDDVREFRKSAASFRKEANRMDRLVKNYEKQAERLKERLGDTRRLITEAGEDWQEDRAELFREQMNPYDAYTDADGVRRQEILKQLSESDENLKRLDRTEELVEEAEDAWRERREAARQEGMDGHPDKDLEDGLSLAAAAECWSGYLRSGMELEYGRGDKEKQALLDRVKELAQNGLLELVLPEGTEVSSGEIAVGTLPSHHAAGESTQTRGPAERVLIHEYCGHFFTNAVSEEKKPVQYEMEYLLYGNGRDRDNLRDTMTQLLMLRQGLNLICLLSDPARRDEARGLAAVVAGATGLAPLTEVMACFIMCVWAMGEAVMDLRTLYAGGRVPLWKGSGDWKLSLEGLLDMGRETARPAPETEGRGYPYETYLKLMLFLTERRQLQLRMLDLMELNIKRLDGGFAMDGCVYRMGITGKASGKHVFFCLPFVEAVTGKAASYPLEAPALRAY